MYTIVAMGVAAYLILLGANVYDALRVQHNRKNNKGKGK